MKVKTIKGFDLPITGGPEQFIEAGAPISRVAAMGVDYVALKATMSVSEGDRVRAGQLLFADKKNAGLRVCAPGGGVVESVNRGARRALLSVVVRLDEVEDKCEPACEPMEPAAIDETTAEQLRAALIESGLWTAFRVRPYSRVPTPEDEARAIFVTAMDTNPLAADPQTVIAAYLEPFLAGLRALLRLTDGPVHLCTAPEARIPVLANDRLVRSEFDGPHPAGLAGTHIHFLDPVGPGRTVWHIGYQDVIDIGTLLTTGQPWRERIVSLAGPMVGRPRLVRTRAGAATSELVQGELHDGEARVISGSVLNGRHGDEAVGYLGRYHTQVSVLGEGRARDLFGWIIPSPKKFSFTNTYLSALKRKTLRFPFTTSVQGSPRAMVPIGVYEGVMPLDILPTQLLRALLVRDTDMAQKLGCLELDEEDLALCSFVCPGKYDFGPVLRANLDQIEKEG
ncbi:MAG: Na(+)-translocating NADH-quinone reductase subunit A [Pseudomonadota bacterium]